MKILARPIEMIAWFKADGSIKPIKFRVLDEDEQYKVVVIDQVVSVDKEKFAGNIMYLFRCQSQFGEEERLFEVKYEVDTCKWMLFKM